MIFLLMAGISQPFQPCCLANANYSCGNVDDHGKPLYALCEDPGSTFFWDNSHPSQAGWKLVTQHYTNISFLTDTKSITQANVLGSSTSMASKLLLPLHFCWLFLLSLALSLMPMISLHWSGGLVNCDLIYHYKFIAVTLHLRQGDLCHLI